MHGSIAGRWHLLMLHGTPKPSNLIYLLRWALRQAQQPQRAVSRCSGAPHPVAGGHGPCVNTYMHASARYCALIRPRHLCDSWGPKRKAAPACHPQLPHAWFRSHAASRFISAPAARHPAHARSALRRALQAYRHAILLIISIRPRWDAAPAPNSPCGGGVGGGAACTYPRQRGADSIAAGSRLPRLHLSNAAADAAFPGPGAPTSRHTAPMPLRLGLAASPPQLAQQAQQALNFSRGGSSRRSFRKPPAKLRRAACAVRVTLRWNRAGGVWPGQRVRGPRAGAATHMRALPPDATQRHLPHRDALKARLLRRARRPAAIAIHCPAQRQRRAPALDLAPCARP